MTKTNPVPLGVSCAQAAGVIGCSPRYVRTLINQRKLRARQVPNANGYGYRYLVLIEDAVFFSNQPTDGRGFPRGRKRGRSGVM